MAAVEQFWKGGANLLHFSGQKMNYHASVGHGGRAVVEDEVHALAEGEGVRTWTARMPQAVPDIAPAGAAFTTSVGYESRLGRPLRDACWSRRTGANRTKTRSCRPGRRKKLLCKHLAPKQLGERSAAHEGSIAKGWDYLRDGVTHNKRWSLIKSILFSINVKIDRENSSF
jgi:hypothetical protein